MCEHCRIRTLNRGQLLNVNYWDGSFVVLVRGLLIAGYDETGDEMFVTGFASNGAIVGNSKAFKNLKTDLQGRLINCITKCTTAVFNEDFVYDLCKTDPDHQLGTYILLSSLKTYWVEKEDITRTVNGKDARAAVRFVVKYCNDHQIPQLTHEQIALMSNRARPTVSKIMQELLRSEPELFTFWGKA
jgi:hypothetical protein